MADETFNDLIEMRLLVIEKQVNGIIADLQDALSTQEKMIATVATGYAELTVLVDALIAIVDHKGDAEEIKVFTETIENKRKEMLNVLSNFNTSNSEEGSMDTVSTG